MFEFLNNLPPELVDAGTAALLGIIVALFIWIIREGLKVIREANTARARGEQRQDQLMREHNKTIKELAQEFTSSQQRGYDSLRAVEIAHKTQVDELSGSYREIAKSIQQHITQADSHRRELEDRLRTVDGKLGGIEATSLSIKKTNDKMEPIMQRLTVALEELLEHLRQQTTFLRRQTEYLERQETFIEELLQQVRSNETDDENDNGEAALTEGTM